MIASWSWTESALSSPAITAAAGSPREISSAMFGPESTATGRSSTSVESRLPVAGSRPFVRLRIGHVPGSAATVSPNAALGTATTARFASATGACSIVVAATP